MSDLSDFYNYQIKIVKNCRMITIKNETMKKTFLLICILFCCTCAYSQLKVYSNGNASVASTLDSVHARLNVGNRDYISAEYNVSLLSSSPATSSYNIGVEGWAMPSTPRNSGRTYGVRGIAGNCTNGYNYGVLGRLHGNKYGAAIYGTVGSELGTLLNGKYAGYFDGDVCVEGVTMAMLSNPYDDNTLPVSSLSATAALSLLSRYTPCFTAENANTPHLGLYIDDYDDMPCLVVEDEQGYEYVNYTEVIPILVACVQELQARVDAMQESNSGTFDEEVVDAIDHAQEKARHECKLYQNTPNPFGSSTVIRYSIPNDAANAEIIIFDMQGTMLSQIPITPSGDKITLNGTEFPAGMYLYTLVVNGKEMDTKRMIITK